LISSPWSVAISIPKHFITMSIFQQFDRCSTFQEHCSNETIVLSNWTNAYIHEPTPTLHWLLVALSCMFTWNYGVVGVLVSSSSSNVNIVVGVAQNVEGIIRYWPNFMGNSEYWIDAYRFSIPWGNDSGICVYWIGAGGRIWWYWLDVGCVCGKLIKR
jgi:hypothetical protein